MLIVCSLGLTACQAASYTAVVSAGDRTRDHVPVSVELELPTGAPMNAAAVSAQGVAQPAQLEHIGRNRARVWWLVRDLEAGQSRSYAINLQPTASSGPGDFRWVDSSKAGVKSSDLLHGDRPVLRYMYTPFDANDIENTKKPFHHVFDPDGSRPITKGVGGKYSHHRGIFFGYNKCAIDGQIYDTWHGAKGEHQLHVEEVARVEGPVAGGHTVKIHWRDRDSKPFIEETRRLMVFAQPDGQLLIDFESTLRPVRGPVSLAGDRQHAGAQFRAAQEVADNEKDTRYLRPAKWSELPTDTTFNTPEHKDLPWNALQYRLGDRAYTVAYLTDPSNPGNAEFSEREYGRFGEFFPFDVTDERPLHVRYQWWVVATHDIPRERIESQYQQLADPPKIALQRAATDLRTSPRP